MTPLFRDPPPRAKVPWPERLEPLRAHPRRWAMVKSCPTRTTASSTASKLRDGTFKVPPGRWEFRAAGVEVFARYMGPDK